MKKKVWVIGGARGIGSEIVSKLAQEKFEVSFTYNSSIESAQELIARLHNQGLSVSAEQLNLSCAVDVAEFGSKLQTDQELFSIIYCAAAKYDSLLATTQDQKILSTFETNVISAIQLVRAATRPMMRNRNGRVILISSIAAQRTGRGNSVYAATKGALESFCRSVANELAPRGVTINCISPGFVSTKMMDDYGEKLQGIVKSLPTRRLGTVDEIANSIPFFLSEQSSYINGTTLVIDGAASGSFQM